MTALFGNIAQWMQAAQLGKLFFVFFVGAVIGFIHEELYYWIFFHKPGWYGSLWGPYIPIYGFGALAILLISRVITNPVVLFVLVFVGSGILEHFTGVVILKLTGRRFWDYRNFPFNFDKEGFVCLYGALAFSFAGVLMQKVLGPWLVSFYDHIGAAVLDKWMLGIACVMTLDFIVSFFIKANPHGEF